MRIGLVLGVHGRWGEAPGWHHICEQARMAEAIGFDLVVVADALLYRSEDRPSVGYWESSSLVGALAATSRIEVGHSVINARTDRRH